MRCELSGYERGVIRPMLPNKPRARIATRYDELESIRLRLHAYKSTL